MKCFKAVSQIIEYYKETIKQTENLISVWNSINEQYDYYEFIDGFWILTD